jgi:hypothetical protein
MYSHECNEKHSVFFTQIIRTGMPKSTEQAVAPGDTLMRTENSIKYAGVGIRILKQCNF